MIRRTFFLVFRIQCCTHIGVGDVSDYASAPLIPRVPTDLRVLNDTPFERLQSPLALTELFFEPNAFQESLQSVHACCIVPRNRKPDIR